MTDTTKNVFIYIKNITVKYSCMFKHTLYSFEKKTFTDNDRCNYQQQIEKH